MGEHFDAGVGAPERRGIDVPGKSLTSLAHTGTLTQLLVPTTIIGGYHYTKGVIYKPCLYNTDLLKASFTNKKLHAV